jgi:hypothetical protein
MSKSIPASSNAKPLFGVLCLLIGLLPYSFDAIKKAELRGLEDEHIYLTGRYSGDRHFMRRAVPWKDRYFDQKAISDLALRKLEECAGKKIVALEVTR